MSLTIKDFSTEKPAYILSCNSYGKYADETQEVAVSKVGRKYVTVRIGAWDHKFEIPAYDQNAGYLREVVGFGEGDLLFLTEEAFYLWKERRDLLSWFDSQRYRFSRYDTDLLRAAKEVLCKEE